MTEKDMVLDMLSEAKANIVNYSKMLIECGDTKLRETFKTLRNETEEFQYNLYKIAEKKGYYIPSPVDTEYEIQELKSKLTKAFTTKAGAGPVPLAK